MEFKELFETLKGLYNCGGKEIYKFLHSYFEYDWESLEDNYEIFKEEAADIIEEYKEYINK